MVGFTKVSVHAPSSQDGNLAIILNTTAQPMYDLSGSNSAEGSTVVKKDQRALVRSKKRKIGEISFGGIQPDDGFGSN